MSASVKITGLSQLQATLKKLPAKVQKKVLRSGMAKGGRIVAKRAKELVPVLTGELRNSIKVRGLKSAQATRFRGGKAKIGKQIVATASHAHIIELGRKGVEGEHFLSDAGVFSEDAVMAVIAQSVSDGLKES